MGIGMNMFLMGRHGREINGMFLDFSVRRVGPWTKAGGVQPEDWPKWMRECKDY